jgi:hypothetical protein
MKKFLAAFLVLPFLLAGVANAQPQSSGGPTPAFTPAKVVSISGKLSDDGKTFVAKHGKVWTVTNPDVLSGHAGHELKLKCQVLAATHEIQVLAVKVLATQVHLTANPSDSAFRR